MSCPHCNKAFASSHAPALSTHLKFCKALHPSMREASTSNDGCGALSPEVMLPEISVRLGCTGNSDSPVQMVVCSSKSAQKRPMPVLCPPEAELSESSWPSDEEPEVEDVGTSSSRPRKTRKSDGLPKQSGLAEGARRVGYTIYYKHQVVLEHGRNMDLKVKNMINNPLEKTSRTFSGLSKSCISKWYKNRDAISAAMRPDNLGHRGATGKEGTLMLSNKASRRFSLHAGRSGFWLAAEEELITQFRSARAKGLKVNERWMCLTMKKLIQQIYGEEAAKSYKGSHGWLARFAARNNLSLRCINYYSSIIITIIIIAIIMILIMADHQPPSTLHRIIILTLLSLSFTLFQGGETITRILQWRTDSPRSRGGMLD
jgi:hypothetical protein